jgi:hypothetical protein
MAAWDQAGYKQDVVDGYGPLLRRARPVMNAAATLIGARPLTSPGRAIPLAFAACVCVKDDDRGVLRVLIARCARHAYGRGKAFLMIGLADNDPLLPAARRFLHVTYHSELVALGASQAALDALDDRIPYVEIATL